MSRTRFEPVAELVVPFAHLLVVVQEVAFRGGGHVDAVEKIERPPDDLVLDESVGRTLMPLGRPPVRLVTCASAVQHGGEPAVDLVPGRQG